MSAAIRPLQAARNPATGGPRRLAAGFTLLELALVLFVLTLLMAGMMTPLTRQITERQALETRRAMAEARDALLGYALGHRDPAGRPYLPCPDQRSGPHAGDGLEDRRPDGGCVTDHGLLPWATLGLTQADAWGNRYSYAVAPAYAHAQAGISAHPPPPTTLTLCLGHGCASRLQPAAILVSHGPNGLGATNSVGGRNLPPNGADERQNADDDGVFVSRSPTTADRPGGEFDDLVLWLSASGLIGQLCGAAAAC
ncbi:MAG: type II secretion system GspH family protein [Thiobacillaceae bacterium]|nr:type II secretion system GspH family protein [Thiobacillaceae bacterium]